MLKPQPWPGAVWTGWTICPMSWAGSLGSVLIYFMLFWRSKVDGVEAVMEMNLLKPASECTVSSQHCSPPAPLSACKLIALAGSHVQQPVEFQGLHVLSESTWIFQCQEMESLCFCYFYFFTGGGWNKQVMVTLWWWRDEVKLLSRRLPISDQFFGSSSHQVKKTSEATLTTIQDMVTIEDYDVSECFHHSRSTESVKSTVSETYLSKPSIAKRRANQQETEQFYFMVSTRKAVLC